MGYGLGCVRGEAVRGSAGSEGGIMWPCGPGAHVLEVGVAAECAMNFFFFFFHDGFSPWEVGVPSCFPSPRSVHTMWQASCLISGEPL